MSFATISPKELLDLTQAGKQIDLIDVRTPVEFREVHVTFARNLPLDRLDPAAIAAERNGSERPLYVICRSGNRGKQACEKLLRLGLLQHRQRRRGHSSLRTGRLACRPRQEGGVAGASGPRSRRCDGADRRPAGHLCASVLECPGGVCRCRADLCRDHRHLRHGDGAGSDAVESSARSEDLRKYDDVLDLVKHLACNAYS
jgi:rhodanese-related sulfurtransferase